MDTNTLIKQEMIFFVIIKDTKEVIEFSSQEQVENFVHNLKQGSFLAYARMDYFDCNGCAVCGS